MTTVEKNSVAEALGGVGAKGGRERFGAGGSGLWALAGEFYFDEFMVGEGLVDSGGESVGEAVFAELNARREVVAERAEKTTLFAGE